MIPTNTDLLEPEDIKTNVPNESAIVRVSTTTTQHINLKNVLHWRTEGKSLVITTLENSIPIVLSFLSIDRAITAEVRFTAIKNGGILL